MQYLTVYGEKTPLKKLSFIYLFAFQWFPRIVLSPKTVCQGAVALDTRGTHSASSSVVSFKPCISYELAWWGHLRQMEREPREGGDGLNTGVRRRAGDGVLKAFLQVWLGRGEEKGRGGRTKDAVRSDVSRPGIVPPFIGARPPTRLDPVCNWNDQVWTLAFWEVSVQMFLGPPSSSQKETSAGSKAAEQ